MGFKKKGESRTFKLAAKGKPGRYSAGITVQLVHKKDKANISFGEKLEQFGIRDYRNFSPQLTNDGRIVSRKLYRLEPFLSGDYKIPAMTIKFYKESVPPAINTSQKLIRLPRVTYGNRIVCFNPTQCAHLENSSSKQASLMCAPLAIDTPSRNVDDWKYPPLRDTPFPTWQSKMVAGASSPISTPSLMIVFLPMIFEPACITTPGDIISGDTSFPISTASGDGIITPLLRNSLIFWFICQPLEIYLERASFTALSRFFRSYGLFMNPFAVERTLMIL